MTSQETLFFSTESESMMTYDDWIEWYRTAAFLGHESIVEFSQEDWIDWNAYYCSNTYRLTLLFKRYQTSEMILKDFLNYPLSLQLRISDQMYGNTSIRDIETVTSLCLLLSETRPEIVDWLDATPVEMINAIIEKVGSLSSEFRHEADDFSLRCYSKEESGDSWRSIWVALPAILLMLHGEQAVTEVLKSLRERSLACTAHELSELSNRWAELRSFPIEWSLRLITSSALIKENADVHF